MLTKDAWCESENISISTKKLGANQYNVLAKLKGSKPTLSLYGEEDSDTDEECFAVIHVEGQLILLRNKNEESHLLESKHQIGSLKPIRFSKNYILYVNSEPGSNSIKRFDIITK